MKIVKFPENRTAEQLAENFLDFARDGHVKWAIMVIVEADDSMRFEWTRLPSNLAAVGAVEMLKQNLMEQ